MSKKKRFKPIFKRHKINGHPSYIYDEYEDQYKYIGITHAKITQGVKNKKLRCNPNVKYGFVYSDCIDYGSGDINCRSYRYRNKYYKEKKK